MNLHAMKNRESPIEQTTAIESLRVEIKRMRKMALGPTASKIPFHPPTTSINEKVSLWAIEAKPFLPPPLASDAAPSGAGAGWKAEETTLRPFLSLGSSSSILPFAFA